MPAPLLDDLAPVDLAAMERAPARRVLLVESHPDAPQEPLRAHLERLGADVELRPAHEPNLWVWAEDYGKVHVPRALLEAVVTWVEAGEPVAARG